MNYQTWRNDKELHSINGQMLSLADLYSLLDIFSTNELDQNESNMLQQHILQCQICQHLLKEIKQYHSLLANVMSDQVPVRESQTRVDRRSAVQLSEQFLSMQPSQPGQSAPLLSKPQRGQQRMLQRASTRLLIAALVLLLIGANFLIFHTVLPQLQQQPAAQSTSVSPAGASSTPTAPTTVTAGPGAGWQHLWTLPALPPAASGAYGVNLPYIPQFGWSPANPQRLYLCRAVINYQMPAILHYLYRSDDTGAHWSAYPMPEVAANCRLQVDVTNANALVLQDNNNNSFVSQDGGQHWQKVPAPPTWNTHFAVPPLQIVAGRLYAGGYWTEDLIHWTLWYPVAHEKTSGYPVISAYPLVNPQHPAILYTAIPANEFHCTGSPNAVQYQIALCRSDDGGQSWHFLAQLYSPRANPSVSLCMSLSNPSLLYASGAIPQGPNGWLASTNGGASWTSLSGAIAGSQDSLECNAGVNNNVLNMAGTNTTPAATIVDVWQNKDNPAYTYFSFALAPNGVLYHAGLSAVMDQGTALPSGISIFRDNTWKQIVPSFPIPVASANASLRIALITPPSDVPFLLAYTDGDVYIYHLDRGSV